MKVSWVVFAALFAALGLTLVSNNVAAATLQASSAGARVIQKTVDTLRSGDEASVKLVRQRGGRGRIRGGGNRQDYQNRGGGSHKARGSRGGVRNYQSGRVRTYRARRVRSYGVRPVKRSRVRKSRRSIRDRGIYRKRVSKSRRTYRRRYAGVPKRTYKKRSVRRYSSKRGRRSRHRRRGYRHFYRGWYYTYPWWLYVAALPYYGYGDAHVAWCLSRYRSYDPRTNTYLGYDGYRHECVSPYSY